MTFTCFHTLALWLASEGMGYGSVKGDWLAEGAAEMDGPLTSESIPCRPAGPCPPACPSPLSRPSPLNECGAASERGRDVRTLSLSHLPSSLPSLLPLFILKSSRLIRCRPSRLARLCEFPVSRSQFPSIECYRNLTLGDNEQTGSGK